MNIMTELFSIPDTVHYNSRMIYQPKLPQVQSHCYLPKNISDYLLESMKYEQRNQELK